MYESITYARIINVSLMVPTPVVAAGYDAATTAWVAAVVGNGGTVSDARKTVVNDLIVGLKADGIWTKLDRLWLFAGENQPSALTDLVATALATATSSPVFVVDMGYTSAGAGSWINSNFNPTTAGSPHFVQNSASMFEWAVTEAGDFAAQCGYVSDANADLRILPNYAAGGNTYWGINNSQQGPVLSLGSYVGLWLANRSASNAATLDLNGSQQTTTATASSAPKNDNMSVLSDAGSSCVEQIACYGFGESLSSGERTAIYTHLRTYMTAVGVP